MVPVYDASVTLLIFCPSTMYIVASKLVELNALVPMVTPVVQFVDATKVTVVSLAHS